MISAIPVTSNGVPHATDSRCVSMRAAVAAILILALPQAAQAQHVNTDLWETDEEVSATVVAGNTLYIGGDFTYVGPHTGGGVPVNAVSGTGLSGFPKVNGMVVTVMKDGSGGWFIVHVGSRGEHDRLECPRGVVADAPRGDWKCAIGVAP